MRHRTVWIFIFSQCEQVEAEMATNLQIQRANLHRLIDVLHTYSTIVAQVTLGVFLLKH